MGSHSPLLLAGVSAFKLSGWTVYSISQVGAVNRFCPLKLCVASLNKSLAVEHFSKPKTREVLRLKFKMGAVCATGRHQFTSVVQPGLQLTQVLHHNLLRFWPGLHFCWVDLITLQYIFHQRPASRYQ